MGKEVCTGRDQLKETRPLTCVEPRDVAEPSGVKSGPKMLGPIVLSLKNFWASTQN